MWDPDLDVDRAAVVPDGRDDDAWLHDDDELSWGAAADPPADGDDAPCPQPSASVAELLASAGETLHALHGELVPSVHAAAQESPAQARTLGARVREATTSLDQRLVSARYAVGEADAQDGNDAGHAIHLQTLEAAAAARRGEIDAALVAAPAPLPSDMTSPHAAEALEALGEQGASGATRGADDAAWVHRSAEEASADDVLDRLGGGQVPLAGGAPLPHLDTIQSSFGRHDVGGITAHVGGPARAVAGAIDALAFTRDDHVGFAAPPDLRLAAHEAAHAVQQTGHTQRKAAVGAVGTVGDDHERHADRVAEAVVRGESAEALLDQAPAGPPAVQLQSADDVPAPADAPGPADASDHADPPGYLEETGFGSLRQVQKNRDDYEASEEFGRTIHLGEEYVPDLGAPDQQRPGMSPEELGRTDLDDDFETNDLLRDRVAGAAGQLDIDPGLLAATLFAEYSTPTRWTMKSGTTPSEKLGLDDWFDPTMAKYIKKVLKEHPEVDFKYADVQKTGKKWDSSTEKPGGAWKPRGKVDGRKAVMAVAIYQKAQNEVLAAVVANLKKKDPSLPDLEDLTPEQQLTLQRLTFNAGVGNARTLYLQLAKGKDIPRTGSVQRDPHNPRRTAVLHVARAIHLSQKIFGKDAQDYRP
ncbi:MAG: DUF4157 domain-containing protein [Myxococcales bacterium]|nr:DUF4157 domain-containing protein [Myxococcales bacterium]